MPTEALFSRGEHVRRRSAPDKSGIIKECYWSDQTEEWVYKVHFGMPPAKSVPETDLEPVPADADCWQDLVDGRMEGVAVYQKLLTFERINRPPSRVAESFGTARAKLLPYQFKPLLKFLDSSQQRLLIADDVGLGKTIEAGYIFKELKARHGIEQCLIVVPARLRPKWKRELDERFDERFELVNAADIRTRLFDRMASGNEPDPFLWIASYESLRRPEIVDGFTVLQPSIDLVILDEAHRVRNSATEQNHLARVLSECANAMLLLTATPVQIHLENLFQLLRLIDPESFSNFGVFQNQLEANQPVVRALRKVRLGSRTGLDEAAAELRKLADHPLTAALTTEPFFQSLFNRLEAAQPKDRKALVDLQRDIGELSLTGGSISRTRKVDVMPDRPIRKSQSVRVTMSPDERAIYQAIAMRFMNRALTSSWGSAMAMLQALRLTASCIPAAVEYFATRGLGRGFGADVEQSPDERSPSADDEEAAEPVTPVAVPTVDSKFEALLKVLREHAADTGESARKTVVFAFFKPTLRYLSKRLSEQGIEHRLIHGDVDIPQREVLIDEFVRNNTVRVLLSSEVGSEGVDLQVASIVVNYDLPWNPMVVEQRIGRLDRIGQHSPIISIVNLVLKNTVEERVLLRLYERIDLFERTIGEIEDILGDALEELALQYLRQELTPEEAERQADQRADAFLQEQKQASDLQDRADQLLAGDQAFLDEIEGLFGERRVPGPEELYRFLRKFLDDRFPGCEFPPEIMNQSLHVHLQAALGSELQKYFPSAPDVRRFAMRLQAGTVAVTMDSDAYLRVGSAEFISMHHCLVRLACMQMQRDMEALHRTFRLRVPGGEDVEPGEYVMGVIELEVSGIRPRVELRPIAMKVGSGGPVPVETAKRLFIASLEQAASLEDCLSTRSVLSRTVDRLRKEADVERARLKESESTLGALRAARRRATQEGTLRHRLKAAKDRLGNLQAQKAGGFSIRMADRKLQIEQARFDAFTSQTEPDGATVIAPRDIAVVLIRVEQT